MRSWPLGRRQGSPRGRWISRAERHRLRLRGNAAFRPVARGALLNRAAFTSLVLALAWLAWSGQVEPLPLGLGLLSVAAVVGITRRMDRFSEVERDEHLGLGVVFYLPWLFWRIAKANAAVARIILDPGLPIRPRLVRVRASQRTATGQVLYANSITLTPGTISLDLRDDTILVHALTAEAAAGLEDGEMDRRVCRLEGRD